MSTATPWQRRSYASAIPILGQPGKLSGKRLLAGKAEMSEHCSAIAIPLHGELSIIRLLPARLHAASIRFVLTPPRFRRCVGAVLELARSTICGWHEALGGLIKPLVEAMWEDAGRAVPVHRRDRRVGAGARAVPARPLLGGDPPERHVLFGYTAKHDGAAVDGLLEGYEGYLVADAPPCSTTCTGAEP